MDILKKIKKIIKKAEKEKIYKGLRVQQNLLLVEYKVYNKFLVGKKYDMTYLGNNRICLDIHKNATNEVKSQKLFIPNNVRSKLPDYTGLYELEINVLNRWNER